jgi:hypothetical protein
MNKYKKEKVFESYLIAIGKIIERTSPLFLFNHATTARTYYGSLLATSTFKSKPILISAIIGLSRIFRIMVKDLLLLQKAVDAVFDKPRHLDEVIFTPSGSFNYDEEALRAKYFSEIENQNKIILTTKLSLGFKNRTINNLKFASNVYVLDSSLRTLDIIFTAYQALGRLVLYLSNYRNSHGIEKNIYKEAIEFIHTEYSAMVLYKSIIRCDLKECSEITYTHFEFEFGRAISLAFASKRRIGRAHGLIHPGKLQFQITKSLMTVFPDYFPNAYEIEDNTGTDIFPCSKNMERKVPKIDIDWDSKNLHIICSLHTTYEEISSCIKKLNKFDFFSIHLHPRARNSKKVKNKFKGDVHIDSNPKKIGKFITGFESRLILESIQSGAVYIPHYLDIERSEYLENSIPEKIGLDNAVSG